MGIESRTGDVMTTSPIIDPLSTDIVRRIFEQWGKVMANTSYRAKTCEICGNYRQVATLHRQIPAMPSQHSNEVVPRKIVICKDCIAENDRIEANEDERRKST